MQKLFILYMRVKFYHINGALYLIKIDNVMRVKYFYIMLYCQSFTITWKRNIHVFIWQTSNNLLLENINK